MQRFARDQVSEVWPAYVDALAASFAFLLLVLAIYVFIVSGTKSRLDSELNRSKDNQRTYAAANDVRHGAEAKARGIPEHFRDVAAQGMHDGAAANAMAIEELLNGCETPQADKVHLEPEDAQHRAGVLVVCRLPECMIHFVQGQREPNYGGHPGCPVAIAAQDRKAALQSLVGVLLKLACARNPPADELGAWCVEGLEVSGHTDAVRREAKGYTNWELSTDRAGQVIRDLTQPYAEQLDAPELREQFHLLASGYESRAPAVECPAADKNAECHGKNRRVELRIRLRSEPLPANPTLAEAQP